MSSPAITPGTPINGWPKVASGLSETLETPPAALSVHKFPFLEVSPTSAMTHIAFQEQLNGIAVNWLEEVTDEQYRLTK
jgi:hypothetical protein